MDQLIVCICVYTTVLILHFFLNHSYSELSLASPTYKIPNDAMDQLVKHKTRMEQRFAKRHLKEGGLVLYDVTSSYVEGQKNELAAYGYSRGKQQIVIGLMTDPEGCPVSVDVFRGNTADISTIGAQVTKLQQTFDLQHVVLVGDRGILRQK